MADFTDKQGNTYSIVMLRPPGDIVAPNGFPTDPRPKGAPQVFLDAMDVRITVFCDEQKCTIESELDEDDARSWHWVAYQHASSQTKPKPVSVIRIVPPPHGPHPNGYVDYNEDPYCKLGRVATLSSARGRGLSRQLVDVACEWLSWHHEEVGHGWTGNLLAHAQVGVEKMYGNQGFVTDDKLGRWDEEGIEHLGMWRRVPFNKA